MTRLVILTMLAAAVLADASQPLFKSKVESVRVDVLASADGRPVTDLTADDFEIRDNGVLQKASKVGDETAPVNAVIALDTSSSLSLERLARLRAGSTALIRNLRAGESAGLVTFNHVITQVHQLTQELNPLVEALALVTPSGQTALIDATSLALTLAEHGDGRALLVVFSDGVDTASWQSEATVLRSARGSETVVYAVVVASKEGSPRFLRDLTSATGGKVLEVESNERLEAAFVQILDEFRQRYLLSYSPTGVSKPGWHKIEVRVKRRGVTAKARPGYVAR